MSERRPWSSMMSGEFDYPAATNSPPDTVNSRLDRLQRTLERQRESSLTQASIARNERSQNMASRHERWGAPPSSRRRRLLRPADSHPPTYEGRSWSRRDDSPLDGEGQPNAKRRRLDPYTHPLHTQTFKYGYHGQVEPGRLKMELCSYDGGVHDERGASIYYGPKNVLRHDQSVYCSKSSRCSIVLRHHDGTAFCLSKLYILAPENGFTAPVKKGSVYISMNMGDLIPMVTDDLGSRRGEPEDEDGDDQGDDQGDDHGDDEPLSLIESLRDPRVSDAMRSRIPSPSSGHISPPTHIPEPLEPANPAGRRGGRIWGEFNFPSLEPIRALAGSPRSAEEPPQSTETFLESGTKVTMAYDEKIDWPEESTNASVLADRHRRSQRGLLQEYESDDEQSRAWDERYRSSYNRLRRGTRVRAANEANTPPWSNAKSSSQGCSKIQFNIEHKKHRVAISFDPPISGNCILLQMESAFPSRNVDIQAVIACGYAGPRFFPALELK